MCARAQAGIVTVIPERIPMDADEDFVSSLRPQSTFGALGASDHFDMEEEDDGYDYDDEYDDDPSYQQIPQARPITHGVGGFPVAVSGTGAFEEPGSKLGAAITLFCVLGGAGAGWHFGRFKGAAGGALVGGALRNLYRTQRTISSGGDTGSAVKQGIIGVVGILGGGYLLWTASRK